MFLADTGRGNPSPSPSAGRIMDYHPQTSVAYRIPDLDRAGDIIYQGLSMDAIFVTRDSLKRKIRSNKHLQ